MKVTEGNIIRVSRVKRTIKGRVVSGKSITSKSSGRKEEKV
jgi:hypothetical protein